MNKSIRLALLVLCNMGSYLGFLAYGYQQGWNLSKRPVEMSLSNPQDAQVLCTFLLLLLVVLCLNVLIFGTPARIVSRAVEQRIQKRLTQAMPKH